jgi:methylated-DNA-[protein]-cysteine S-methyltransferase
VTTYGALAQQLAAAAGKPKMSAQAVGGAVGHNPISVIIPCHRVVGAGGNLTGYGGGIERKIALLRHEGLDMSRFYVPKTGAAL